MNAKLLQESFILIAPTKEAFAHAFYTRLFDHYPSLRGLFVQDMAIQERSLAATLQIIVQASEQEETLVPTLHRMGKRHVTYGVVVEQYPLLGRVLLQTFHHVLGEQFTPEMHCAWDDAYKTVTAIMLNATIED